jgi:CRISPR-associated endonuclease/helicase Cas3
VSERVYEKFFRAATSYKPFDYQRRLAGGNSGIPCRSQLIDVPTGLGKTAAAVLAWLWNRVQLQNQEWPRRLVYCLPMRTLVEQTRDNVCLWLKNLGNLQWDKLGSHRGKVGIHILMGGEEREHNPWDLYPEESAILIGTQDMLLSRALNRGYAMSRYRWPMHFGLLNNDCLWVFDEVQLMGNGLATGIQLDAFRRTALWSTAKPCVSWWMSATSSFNVFTTTDRTELKIPSPEKFGLTEEEREAKQLDSRLRAEKILEFRSKAPRAAEVIARHQSGRLTLIILNTIGSALQWHAEIKGQLSKFGGAQHNSVAALPKIILLHSRFRPVERDTQMKQLQEFLKSTGETGAAPADHPGLIVVATQVVEAGMDLSAAVLWSEIAPWAAVIQRLGRLNRDGMQPRAVGIFWMPQSKDEDNAKHSPNVGRNGPYEKITLNQAQQLIEAVVANLSEGQKYRTALDAVLSSETSAQNLKLTAPVVIRSDDVHELFSTEPDLAGGFTNISPFIRTLDLSTDVSVYWRDFDGPPPKDCSDPTVDETVQVPSYLVSRFLAEPRRAAFAWNEDADRWDTITQRDVVAGMTILLAVKTGGYSAERGWTGDSLDKPTTVAILAASRSSLFSDHESKVGWQSLSEHTAAVTKAGAALAIELGFEESWQAAFAIAAYWHDIGKAHPRWQCTLPSAPEGTVGPWGKFSGDFIHPPRVRHEALSLVAAWHERSDATSGVSALALYLIASHHGKVRTVLRSSQDGDDLFGWLSTDEPLPIQGERACPIDLSVRHFAGTGQVDWTSRTFKVERPSWSAIIEELLGAAWTGDSVPQAAISSNESRELGPFQLAYIEAVFRAADARASRGEFSLTQP